MFVNLAARALQNTSQVLVHVDDADVLLVFRGRYNSRCININQSVRKNGPRVSGISIFAAVLLITTAVPISILGMSSSCSLRAYTGCDYVTALSQKGEGVGVRGGAFQRSEADHLDAFAHLSETELLQGFVCCKLEQPTCMLHSSKETRINDARLQTLLS